MEWSGPPDPDAKRKLRVLVYARAKAGKSRFAASAPAPVLVWDFDQNFPTHAFPPGRVAVERCESYAEYRSQLLLLKPAPGGFGVLYDHPATQGVVFYTVVMDTLTQLYPLIMQDVLQLPLKRSPTTVVGDVAPERAAREWPSIQDFGLTGERLKDLIRKHSQLPCHFVAIAHEELYEPGRGAEELGGKRPASPGPRAGISLTDKLNERIPGLFNLFLRIKVENPAAERPRPEHYKVYTVQSDYYYPAGDATGLLDPVEPADLTHIIKKAGGYVPPAS